MTDFADRIAVVTGGGSGMGRALVTQLADAGCHVAMCDISESAMAGTLALCETAIAAGVRVSAHRCDVASETELRDFAARVARQHDTAHIDLLFNNAGVSGGQSFLRDDREEWERVFAICWGGVYLGCRVFMPMLLASPQAHIVNTSSVNGFWACMDPAIEHTAYSAAKFAVKGFSEALLVDLRKHAPHVKISVVMPGYIGTDIALNSNRLWLGDPATMDASQLDKVRERWAGFDPAVRELPDELVRELVHAGGEQFRDNAPTTADEAARIILAGVRQDKWRILVGDDAERVDAAVRADPERAYEPGFAQLLPSRSS